jgi:hypothetical protein
MVPPVVIENEVPVELGVNVAGFGVHGLGGAVEPEVQLNVTALLYPLTAVTVPLKVGVFPEKTVSAGFGIEI